LFEFFLNSELYARLANKEKHDPADKLSNEKHLIDAFRNAGYDYVTLGGSGMYFRTDARGYEGKKSISLNKGAVIHDRASFKAYDWPDPDSYDYSRLEELDGYLPEGMKIIVSGPGGVLENVIALVGYDDLCFMLADDPQLACDVFDAVGSRLLRYCELSAKYDTVGALISNDDWGFNMQTLLSVNDMHKYVFPWHKKIANAIHSFGKPVILHSCGNLELVMDDIINDMKYDGKHSYEDKIMPVEQAYDKYGDRIAIMGGIDLDFLCRSTPEQVYERSAAMIERTGSKGGYGHGSGNSIPYYVPHENYLAMIAAAVWN
jgi:uroporphyrinogen decarboxylase